MDAAEVDPRHPCFDRRGLGAAYAEPRRIERFEDAHGFVGHRSPLLAHLGVPHLFTTRLGGGRRDFLVEESAA